jgi:hypothetical protein
VGKWPRLRPPLPAAMSSRKRRTKKDADVAIGCFHSYKNNQPKFLTKAELRAAAMRELNVSKNSFDFAWMDAIEETGRLDWYEPLRRRSRTRN